MSKSMVKEIPRNSASGYLALVILLGLLVFTGWMFYTAIQQQSLMLILVVVVPCVLSLIHISEPTRH